MFDLVGDLLDRGVAAGDLTSSDTVPFRGWPGATHDVMLRIRPAVDYLDHLPDTGEVCWFAIL
ncbi:hypothetical protein ABLE92_25230 [Gordonia sp. VNQ95]|jgi:hypothetical protein|uniref:hypothetical protein n=1 Tax=Gordonia sp. VNQ95 TaxID=3156619 RepID=UPI0032B39459